MAAERYHHIQLRCLDHGLLENTDAEFPNHSEKCVHGLFFFTTIAAKMNKLMYFLLSLVEKLSCFECKKMECLILGVKPSPSKGPVSRNPFIYGLRHLGSVSGTTFFIDVSHVLEDATKTEHGDE